MESLSSTHAPSSRPHVVLLASPEAGHLIPLAQLARRLVEHHGFAATLVTFADFSAEGALSCVPASVATAVLPAVPADDLPAGIRLETALLGLIRLSLPGLRALLRSIAPIAALVPDFFCSVALPLAAELGSPGYLFFPSNLAALAYARRAVELNDGAAPGEYRVLTAPLQLPGGVVLRRADFIDSFTDASKLVYAHILDEGRRHRRADSFLVNTFREMEPAAVEDFERAAERGAFPPVFAVGPFVRSSSDEAGAARCLEWLDLQPAGLVVYVCFGSAGALSVEQTAELAAGLEASGRRFLWVVRTPTMAAAGDEEDPLAWLPEGFLQRTEERGLAIASWAPQVRVLSHPATAAFVSHCGWNSALESMAAGVPMLAWPLHAEQRINAVILERSAWVALRPRAREDGLVTREEVVAALSELMEGGNGRALRRQAQDLWQAAARAWSPDGS